VAVGPDRALEDRFLGALDPQVDDDGCCLRAAGGEREHDGRQGRDT
jgi:hypothetical protein